MYVVNNVFPTRQCIEYTAQSDNSKICSLNRAELPNNLRLQLHHCYLDFFKPVIQMKQHI